jgi:hypothetical protein
MFLSVFAHAQKVDLEDNTVLVDGKPLLRYEKKGCTLFSAICIYNISDIAGKKEIIIQSGSYQVGGITSAKGRVQFYQIVFLDSEKKAEIKFSFGTKYLMKILVKAKLFENGVLNQKAVNEFVLLHGTPFSDYRSKMHY